MALRLSRLIVTAVVLAATWAALDFAFITPGHSRLITRVAKWLSLLMAFVAFFAVSPSYAGIKRRWAAALRFLTALGVFVLWLPVAGLAAIILRDILAGRY